MPRKPRFFVAGVANHIIQHGNNKEEVFFEEEDYRKYLTILNVAVTKQGVKIHALACMRYIKMNPVRARMVKAPQDYKWSGYHSNVRGVYDPVIVEHVTYTALARSRKKQQESYRDLFLEHLDEKILADIRNCAQTGTPLDNKKFNSQIEAKLKIEVGYNTRGRPLKLNNLALSEELIMRIILGIAVIMFYSSLFAPVFAGEWSKFDEGYDAYISKKYDRAFSILRPLSDAGDNNAQLWLGQMYASGNGVKKSPEQGLYWYGKSWNQGNYAAKVRIDKLMAQGYVAAKEPVVIQ